MKLARLSAAFAFITWLGFGSEQSVLAAGPDPGTEAQRLIQKLDGAETRATVKEPLAKAKAARQRAQNARGAGDAPHATELEVLALIWAQVGDDLVRTAAAEKNLAELETAVSDLEQKSVRTQALIEQTIARRGRAEQNLASAPESRAAPKNPGANSEKEPMAPKLKASAPRVKP